MKSWVLTQTAPHTLLHLFPLGYRHSLFTVCLITARAFMPASLIAIPYTILEISTFLGPLPVDDDDDDDDEKCQLNASIASLR